MKYFVLVDCQNDFIDGVLGTKEAKDIVPKVIERLKQIEETMVWGHEWQFLVTQDTHEQDKYEKTVEGQHIPPHCYLGTDGWKLNEEIRIALNDLEQKTLVCYYNKNTFGAHDLAESFSDCFYNVESVEIAGLCTDICVISNALGINTALRKSGNTAPVIVNSKLCAGTTPENHKAALDVMRSCLIDII